MEKDILIELKNIKKVYDQDTLVVEDFNLEIKKGEFVTLLGPSGCGKTTILRMLGGFDKPTEGTILTVSREVSEASLKRSQESDDFCDVIAYALEKGNKILLKTPDMLPALKKAGVVDAGGQGWLYFLAGVLEYLNTGKVVEGGSQDDRGTLVQGSAQSAVDTKNIKYMY